MAKPQKDGYSGMLNVESLLVRNGFKVARAGYYAPFDLLLDGKLKVEIKTCKGLTNGKDSLRWQFNIHRHGQLNEVADLYILRLEDVPYSKAAIHLLFKSPLKRKTIIIEMRSLMTKYAKYVQDFSEFCKQRRQAKQEVSA